MSKAPAVDYALEIIEYFASQNTEIGISDISNALQINKNAVSRVLEALLEKNWIYMSDGSQKKYRLTLRPFSLITKYTENNSLVKIATPYIEKLNRIFGDSVYLGIKNGRHVLYLVHCDSTREVRINGRTGGEYPLHCAAPGKVLLGFSHIEEIRNYFHTPIERKTENTIMDFDSFMAEADKIKKAGYAIDNQEFAKGIICIAVPVYDSAGNVAASIGVSTLTLYEELDTLTEKYKLLKKAADEVSTNLGYSGKVGVDYE